MDKLIRLFSSSRIPVPLDKQAHFNIGSLIALIAYFFVGYYSLLLVLVVAFAKEWYDYQHPTIHTCDFYYWLATVLGAVVTLGVIYVC
jgi:hypothetical protein